MGSFLSKCKPIEYSCYEVAHTWTPSCSAGALDVGFACVLESVKIYSTVYMGTAALKGRIPRRAELVNLIKSILQSTVFLSYNAFGFVWAHCLVRHILGYSNFWTLSFVPGWLCSFLAVLAERSSRRSMLATYVTNVASESVYNSLRNNNIIPPLPYVDFAVFSASLCGHFYLSRTTSQLTDPVLKATRRLIGDSAADTNRHSEENPNVRATEIKGVESFRSILKATVKHFLFGAFGQQILHLFKIIKSGKPVPGSVFQKMNVGLSLAWLTFASRVTLKLLNYITGCSEGWHSIIAGITSSPAYFLYPNRTIATYSFWKFAEISIRTLSEKEVLPKLPFFTEIVYATSTAILFHLGMMEPHSLRRSYFRFLDQITGGKMSAINRLLIDEEYESSASLKMKYKPNYKAAYISERLKSRLPLLGTLEDV